MYRRREPEIPYDPNAPLPPWTGEEPEPVVFTAQGPVPASKVPEMLASMRDDGTLRTFATGATRDTSDGKLEPWGFTSPLTELAFSEYMHKHRTQSDGQLRDSDNWKKGIPLDAFWHSLSRHVLDLRLLREGYDEKARADDMLDALCAIKFNVDGMIHELMKRA